MDITDNKREMTRLFDLHSIKVKENYKTTFSLFTDWVRMNANENENYLEIPSNETISGHAEILDW